MLIPALHDWNLTPRTAIALQRELARRVESAPLDPSQVHTVAGVDVSYARRGGRFFAGVVVLAFPSLAPVETVTAEGEEPFPYVPGLLSFRELPVLLEAFRRLQTPPDVILVDGQGQAHPRRFGLACHLGLWLQRPTIGCAKSRLCGEYESPGLRRGDRAALMLEGEAVGWVLRTRERVRPLFVSPGHRVDLEAAAALTLACCTRYRLPEPTRLAHNLTNQARERAGDK